MFGHRRKWSISLNVCLIVLSILSVKAEDDTVVEIKQGKVSGIQLSVLSGSVTAYLGIPYGEPPTGAHRFKKSEPRKPWQGIHKATEFGKSCYQYKDEAYSELPGTAMWMVNNEMSEDCLYLNVWVPSPKPKSCSVMVFIYGGGFISGTTSLDLYDGSRLAYSEKVIVVSMNYRVGALGFLALPGNNNAPGNAGLFDQRLALQWVHENIEVFGGNPHSVTIFGHSAGAASVGYHVVSSGSHAYFKNAIIQSGSAIADWAISSNDHARKLALKLAKNLGCSLEDDNVIMTCLQNIDPVKMVEKQVFAETVYYLIYFGPVLDNDFLNDYPGNLVDQTLKETNILMGVTKDDGNPFALFGAPGFSLKNESLITFTNLEQGLRRFFHAAGDKAIEPILLEYTEWEDRDNLERNREAMEQILTDNYFVCPMKLFANKLADNKHNVYFYIYDYRMTKEVWPEWMGVIHGAEIPILFGKPLIESHNYTNEEKVLSKRMMKFWANFARHGNPNGDGEEGFNWPLYSSGEQKYAVLKLDHSEVQEKLNSRHCQFWNIYYPKLISTCECREKS
ncbi:cholinesterase-like [Discoglossus pictus]